MPLYISYSYLSYRTFQAVKKAFPWRHGTVVKRILRSAFTLEPKRQLAQDFLQACGGSGNAVQQGSVTTERARPGIGSNGLKLLVDSVLSGNTVEIWGAHTSIYAKYRALAHNRYSTNNPDSHGRHAVTSAGVQAEPFRGTIADKKRWISTRVETEEVHLEPFNQ